MRQIGRFSFPEQGNVQECDAWEPYIRVRALATRVLVVARTRIEGKWAAYCDAVPGERHDMEFRTVLDNGRKLPENVAKGLFPELAEVPYAP